MRNLTEYPITSEEALNTLFDVHIKLNAEEEALGVIGSVQSLCLLQIESFLIENREQFNQYLKDNPL